MIIDIPTALITILITCFYVIVGIGAAMAEAAMHDGKTRLFCIFFWPIALCIIALAGEIHFDD